MNTSTKYIDENQFLDFNHKNTQPLLSNLIKQSLLFGADKLFIAKRPEFLVFSDFQPQNSKFASKKLSGKSRNYEIQSASPSLSPDYSKSYNQFPMNIITFFPLLMLKLASFQISLFISCLTFPIWCLNFSLMLVFFPFQTLIQVKDYAKQKLIKSRNSFCFALTTFICNRLKAQKSMMKLAVRSGKAFFCAVYAFFVLLGLLILGFVISGVVMRSVVEETIHTTGTLNFDYTKSSPVAVVAVDAPGTTDRRAVPYNHKLQVTVSLTLPESEYNRKLGIFQVRVETLSTNGNLITGSSYPTMLRFKSQPVRIIETFINGVPLITGLKSEVQNLKIVMRDFKEGYEPTAFFKITLDPRAEFQAGSGAPEIYSGTLEVASELPRMKMIVSSWRRTAFVWTGFAVFVSEVVVVVVLCRGVVLQGGRLKSEKKGWGGKVLLGCSKGV